MLVKLHHLPKFFEYDTYLWNHHLHHGCMYFLLENNKTNWRFPHHAAEGWWRMGRQNGCMMIHQAGTKTNTQTVMLVVPPKTSPQLFFVFFFLLTILTASRNSQCFFFDNIDINVYIKYNMYIIYCSMIIYNTVYKYIYIYQWMLWLNTSCLWSPSYLQVSSYINSIMSPTSPPNEAACRYLVRREIGWEKKTLHPAETPRVFNDVGWFEQLSFWAGFTRSVSEARIYKVKCLTLTEINWICDLWAKVKKTLTRKMAKSASRPKIHPNGPG